MKIKRIVSRAGRPHSPLAALRWLLAIVALSTVSLPMKAQAQRVGNPFAAYVLENIPWEMILDNCQNQLAQSAEQNPDNPVNNAAEKIAQAANSVAASGGNIGQTINNLMTELGAEPGLSVDLGTNSYQLDLEFRHPSTTDHFSAGSRDFTYGLYARGYAGSSGFGGPSTGGSSFSGGLGVGAFCSTNIDTFGNGSKLDAIIRAESNIAGSGQSGLLFTLRLH